LANIGRNISYGGVNNPEKNQSEKWIHQGVWLVGFLWETKPIRSWFQGLQTTNWGQMLGHWAVNFLVSAQFVKLRGF